MPELKDFLTSIKELNPDAETFARTLKEISPNLFQVVFNQGHGTATASFTVKEQELQQKITDAEAKVTAAERKLATHLEKTPDIAALRTQHDAELNDLKEQLKRAKKEAEDTINTSFHDLHVERLRSAFIGKGVDPDYAEMQLGKKEIRDRVRIREDRKAEYLQAGKQIAIQADNPLDALAQELFDATPAKFRTSSADGGGGHRGGPSKAGDAAYYDNVRKTAEKSRETKQPKSAAERLGVTRV